MSAQGEQNATELFRTRQRKSFLVVEFTADTLMGDTITRDLQPRLLALVEEQHQRKLALDLTRVKIVSSQFIGLIVALHVKLSRLGGKLAIAGLSDNLTQLLALTRLDRIITISKSIDNCVERDLFL